MPWRQPCLRLSQTTTYKTKVPNARLKKANAVLQKLGLSAGEAFNLMLTQIDSEGVALCFSLEPRLAI
jgi:antitoxin component of RelBE/YafQ-DinJ toxin-antitoxin module